MHHGPRTTAHGPRTTDHGPRTTDHAPRFTVHSSHAVNCEPFTVYRQLLATILLFGLGLAGASQETAHLKLTTSVVSDAAAPGRKVTLAVDVAPKPKIHVYAPGQEGYIAIAVLFDADPAFSTVGKAKYPAAETLVMPALNETQLVYAKPFRITQEVALAASSGARQRTELTIKGKIRYQACDDKICFLPVTVPVTWAVKLTK
jgi:hypothetical protein